MRNLLLDTHSWLWFSLDDGRLSQAAKKAILDPANVKFVSPASYWEIAIKIRLGKYVLDIPYLEFVQGSIEGSGFRTLHIRPEHTNKVATLPFPQGGAHRDPFTGF